MHLLSVALALITAGGLAFANLQTVEHPIVTSDQGEWPGSWKRLYGWPLTAYGSFGYDRSDGGVYWWVPEAIWVDGLVAAGILGFVVLAGELATRLSRPAVP